MAYGTWAGSRVGTDMEISLYLDIWPGGQPTHFSAYSHPSAKHAGAKRYRIVFFIPDPIEPDAAVAGTAEEVLEAERELRS